MEQNPQEIVKLVKGQPDWHLTVNDNYDVIKQKIDDATGEVKREEFEALETEVADLGSNIVDMGATIADQNTTINGQTALIQGVESRIATAEPKITTAQTTATNAATAAATAQTTANTANTTANTATTNINTINNFLTNYTKSIYRFSFSQANNAVTGSNGFTITAVNYYTNYMSVTFHWAYSGGLTFGTPAAPATCLVSICRLGNVCYLDTAIQTPANAVAFPSTENTIDVSLMEVGITAKQGQYFGKAYGINYDAAASPFKWSIGGNFINVEANGLWFSTMAGSPIRRLQNAYSSTIAYVPSNAITSYTGTVPNLTGAVQTLISV